jgi:hypothetical protein
VKAVCERATVLAVGEAQDVTRSVSKHGRYITSVPNSRATGYLAATERHLGARRRVPESRAEWWHRSDPDHRTGALGQRRLAEHQLELEFVLDRHSVSVDERDRRLHLPRPAHAISVEDDKVHAQTLVEAERSEVVVRRREPHTPSTEHLRR